jgi:protein SCO1
MRLQACLLITFLGLTICAKADSVANLQALPDLGSAPDFVLTSQHDTELSLNSLKGKVVVIGFIYASCPDVCGLLTDKMARVQDELGDAFGRDVAFVSITIDPKHDTSEVLRNYAKAFDANSDGWFFLTGDQEKVQKILASYGIVRMTGHNHLIEHNLLTTLVDRDGLKRLQYAGSQFEYSELHQDIMKLLAEK